MRVCVLRNLYRTDVFRDRDKNTLFKCLAFLVWGVGVAYIHGMDEKPEETLDCELLQTKHSVTHLFDAFSIFLSFWF